MTGDANNEELFYIIDDTRTKANSSLLVYIHFEDNDKVKDLSV